MVESLKREYLEYLEYLEITRGIKIGDNIQNLWYAVKEYSKLKCYDQGGSYASWGTEVSVAVNLNGIIYRFKIALDEVE